MCLVRELLVTNENRYWPNRPLGRLVFVVAVVTAVAGALLGRDYFAPSPAPGIPPKLTAGTLLPKPRTLEPFQLTGVDGKPFTLENLRGHWTFLAIGYTSCPDICPTTMATFRSLAPLTTPKGAEPRAQFLFISVDPGRDTPDRIAQYVHSAPQDPKAMAADFAAIEKSRATRF